MAKTKTCSTCGVLFTCGNTAETSCWCNDYPALFSPGSGIDCLCANCLKNACAEKIDAYVTSVTTTAASNHKATALPKTTKLIEQLDYYLEEGNFVFKPWYHLKRGYCCENNCRHCPYGYKTKQL